MIVRLRIIAMIMMVGFGLYLTSCKEPDFADPNKQLQKDTLAIDTYLSANGLQSENDPSGLRMVITKLGTGLPANLYDSVDVDYVGKLFSDGTTFDQGNIKSPFPKLIDGWKVAFQKLPEGSEAVLYLPSYMAYGPFATQGIPANSILVFTITKFKRLIKSTLPKLASDTVAIDNYLESKNIEAVKDSSGIRYVIPLPTTIGLKPTWYNRLSIKYSIKLLTKDDKVVRSEELKPSSIFYSRLIDYLQGMQIGFSKLSVGSKATLYIPSGLGFGPHTETNKNMVLIPANSNLIVDIELQKIE